MVGIGYLTAAKRALDGIFEAIFYALQAKNMIALSNSRRQKFILADRAVQVLIVPFYYIFLKP